jgi:hypothetical protein
MNVLYVIGGIALIVFGIWLSIKKVKTIDSTPQKDHTYDYKQLILAFTSIVCGIILICQHI